MSIALDMVARLDTRDAVDGFDDVGDSAKAMGDAVREAARDVDGAASKLTRTADAADTLDSKASQATGGLGALAAGFELAGAEGYADKLGQAAMATDFLSGVGAIANLVLSTEAGLRAKAAAQAVVHTAATVAQSAATKAAAAGQWALNAAMSANPIGLIILGVVALVAGFVLLYKRSDKFRELVQKVGKVGAKALSWVVDTARDIGKWIGDKVPGALGKMKRITLDVLKAVTWPYRTMFGILKDIVTWVREKIPAGLRAMKDAAVGIADKLLAPFRRMKEYLDDVLQLIHRIRNDSPGMHNGAQGAADYFTGGGRNAGSGPSGEDAPKGRRVTNITNVTGVLDERIVKRITTAQTNLARRTGP